VNVDVRNNVYVPSQITISVGDTIHFTDTQGTHTITNGTGSGDPTHGTLFDVTLTVGQFWDYVGTAPDTIPYYCVPHEFLNMKGVIRITCSNSAPVVNGIGTQTTDEGSLLTVTPSATDGNGDGLTWSGANLPSGAVVAPSTGVLAWTPDYTQSGTYSNVTLIASDGKPCNSTGEAVFTIVVNNANRAPVVNAIPNQSVDVNSLLSVTPTGSDPDGDGLTWSGASLPAGASVNASSGEFTWTPGPPDAGLHPGVTLIASDPALATGSASFDVTVNAPTSVADARSPLAVHVPSLFHDVLLLRVTAPGDEPAEVSVWSVTGARIAVLAVPRLARGENSITWRADGAPDGVYVVRTRAGAVVHTARVVKM
jgi:hypothetical protein